MCVCVCVRERERKLKESELSACDDDAIKQIKKIRQNIIAATVAIRYPPYFFSVNAVNRFETFIVQASSRIWYLSLFFSVIWNRRPQTGFKNWKERKKERKLLKNRVWSVRLAARWFNSYFAKNFTDIVERVYRCLLVGQHPDFVCPCHRHFLPPCLSKTPSEIQVKSLIDHQIMWMKLLKNDTLPDRIVPSLYMRTGQIFLYL